MDEFYINSDIERVASVLRQKGLYRVQHTVEVPDTMAGAVAAEEVFDLTNNPDRQWEREQVYGRHRSVSVGDIVHVDGADYLCASSGWRMIPA